MGLAPYGEPRYVDMLRRLIDVKDDGSFRLTMKYFTFEHGLAMTGTSMEKLLGAPRRKSDEPLTQFHKDIARSLQALTEEIMMRIVRHAKDVCPSRYLCLAGGVALNCVANGKIVKEKLFDEIFIQPAAGDAGGALGAALMVWHKKFDGKRLKKMDAAYLGNTYSPDEIERQLMAMSLPYKKLEKDQIPEVVASLLENNRVIGLFQGKMEFGPRALGNRSIIADARKKDNWQRVNLKIKFREDFRPFAPTVLMEDISRYFNLNQESPYMLLVADVHPDRRSEIPAVTHVDGSARIQTIQRAQNPMYYDIIQAFRAATNCSVIINTSFNIRGEPIVESPRDAIRCFLHTDIDNLLLENFLLSKEEMPARGALDRDAYVASFALD
jgi:carbamoyltransferase